MSVYLGAGCPYSPKQIPSECNRAGAKVGLGDASLTVPSQAVGSLLQPGHLLSSGTAVQMQSVFCLLRIRKERRKWRPVVTSGPFSGAGILASVVPCLPGVGEPPFLFGHWVSFWEGAKAGGIFGFGTVGV